MSSPFPASGSGSLPNTAAGRCAAAYFDAFNSGDHEVMLGFQEHYRSISYLKNTTTGKRSAHYQRLRGIFGRLTPLRVVLSLETQITLLAGAAKTNDALVMRFQLEDKPPHRLAYLTLTGIDHAEVPYEYVGYVATRAAPVGDSLRETTIGSIAGALRDKYIYAGPGQLMADRLLRNGADGKYDQLMTAGKLADRLTEDLQGVSKDRHVWVEAQNPMVQQSSDPLNRPAEALRRDNYDFRKVEVLPNNVGYIKFDMIHDDDEALSIAAAALFFVARCDALIFDIRENIGGEWGTANLVLGYLLPPGTVFARMYDRDGRLVEERTTPEDLPGLPFARNVPVYVLTSSETGSAAEGFAYVLKHLDRATIVGEVTRGMAHPSEEVVVNDYFRVSIPFLRGENAVTGTDWEGTGVVPHVEVRADRALEPAIEDALRRTGNKK
jgi:YD repeat-containing protein